MARAHWVRYGKIADHHPLDCLPKTDYFEEAIRWEAESRALQGGEFKWNIAPNVETYAPLEQLSDAMVTHWYKVLADADIGLRKSVFGPNRAPWDVKRIQVNVGLRLVKAELDRRQIVIVDQFVFD